MAATRLEQDRHLTLDIPGTYVAFYYSKYCDISNCLVSVGDLGVIFAPTSPKLTTIERVLLITIKHNLPTLHAFQITGPQCGRRSDTLFLNNAIGKLMF